MERVVLGLDIGGTHLRSGFVDEQYRLGHFNICSSDSLQRKRPIQWLAEMILSFIEKTGANPLAVSAGFPSTLDKSRRRLLSTPNLSGLNELDMADALEELLGLPVYLDRDVNLLFRYDRYVNRLAGDVLIGCYIGTGLGNVIAVNGEILIGHNGVAAELGHIPSYGIHDTCPCGNVGCVELLASGKRLRTIGESRFPDCDISEIFLQHGNDDALVDYIECLAQPIATEINLLDPDAVVLGGGVLQMAGFPKRRLEAAIARHTRKPYPERNLRFLYSQEKQENGVIGAGIRAWEAISIKMGDGRNDCFGL